MRISKWTLLGAGALLAYAVQLSAQQRYYRSDDRITITKEPVFLPSVVTRIDVDGEDKTIKIPPVEPAPPFRLVDYMDLNDQGVLWYMVTRDSAQIRLASIAQQKASDSRVRDIATSIVDYRSNHINKVVHDIDHEHHGARVGDQALPRDPEMLRYRELVRTLDRLPSGPAFDAAFLQSEYFLHQNEIEVLNANYKNVHDDETEKLIKHSIRSQTQTRDVVRTVSQSLGVNLP
jgi:uncharacterized protein (DUF305 family)